jgi:hypothetical protein
MRMKKKWAVAERGEERRLREIERGANEEKIRTHEVEEVLEK